MVPSLNNPLLIRCFNSALQLQELAWHVNRRLAPGFKTSIVLGNVVRRAVPRFRSSWDMKYKIRDKAPPHPPFELLICPNYPLAI